MALPGLKSQQRGCFCFAFVCLLLVGGSGANWKELKLPLPGQFPAVGGFCPTRQSSQNPLSLPFLQRRGPLSSPWEANTMRTGAGAHSSSPHNPLPAVGRRREESVIPPRRGVTVPGRRRGERHLPQASAGSAVPPCPRAPHAPLSLRTTRPAGAPRIPHGRRSSRALQGALRREGTEPSPPPPPGPPPLSHPRAAGSIKRGVPGDPGDLGSPAWEVCQT